MSHSPTLNRGIAVFSGGSAANNLVDVFNAVRESKKCSLSYIIPISDNGGSSSELIRVFGGPGIGDVRSRLVRLIPESPEDPERAAIKTLFNHRLSSTSSSTARQEWYAIVDGTSSLWCAISSAKKELIRSFFNLLNLEIVKRARPSSTFDFTSASVGNLFLTGARLFSGSFESAIYLLATIGGVPEHTRVLPAINSNFSHHISAGLADGSTIVGQNSISHPSEPIALESPPNTISPPSPHDRLLTQPRLRRRQSSLALEYQDTIEDANLPGSLPTLRKPYIAFSKAPATPDSDSLSSRISRIWYINPYGQEIRPPANPKVVPALLDAQTIIYSIGSLYTSIIPSLILRGVGDAIRRSAARFKILILNGSLDREVGPASNPFTAVDFVIAIAKAGEESRGVLFDPAGPSSNSNAESNHITDDTLCSSPTSIRPMTNALLPVPPPQPLNSIYRSYITHVLYLSGPGTPHVDKAALSKMGIECLRLYGRPTPTPSAAAAKTPKTPTSPKRGYDSDTEISRPKSVERGSESAGVLSSAPPGAVGRGTGMQYDPAALQGAIETVMGRKGDAMVSGERGRSRRNTLEGVDMRVLRLQ